MQRMSPEDRKIVAQVILGVDITEVYSPERIAKVAKEFGLVPGSSMDLTNGWEIRPSTSRMEASGKGGSISTDRITTVHVVQCTHGAECAQE